MCIRDRVCGLRGGSRVGDRLVGGLFGGLPLPLGLRERAVGGLPTYAGLYAQSNWIKAFLKQEFPHEPGTYYRYSTHSSHMLSPFCIFKIRDKRSESYTVFPTQEILL